MPIGVIGLTQAYRTPAFLTWFEITGIGLGLLLTFFLLKGFAERFPSLTIKESILYISFCSVPFLFTYPVDVLDYLANLWYSERVVVYEQNPYTEIQDPEIIYEHSTLPPLSKSPHLPYGPVWLLIHTTIYAPLRSIPLPALTFIMKLLHTSLVLGTMYVLIKLRKGGNQDVATFTSLGMSPLILFSFIGALHNDIYLLFFVAVAVYMLQQKYFSRALLFFTLGIFTKYIIALVMPIVLMWIWHNTDRKKFVSIVAPWASYTTLLAAVSVFVLHIEQGLADQSQLIGFSIIHTITSIVPNETMMSWYATITIAVFSSLYLLHIIAGVRSTLLSSFEFITFCCASLVSLCLIYFLHLWNYWYLAWLLPFICCSPRSIVFRVLSISIPQMLAFFIIWKALLQKITGDLSVTQYATIESVALIFSVGVSIYILHRVIIIPVARKLL